MTCPHCGEPMAYHKPADDWFCPDCDDRDRRAAAAAVARAEAEARVLVALEARLLAEQPPAFGPDDIPF